ncbi:LIG1, partial [Cordylochernes scorpioides]
MSPVKSPVKVEKSPVKAEMSPVKSEMSPVKSDTERDAVSPVKSDIEMEMSPVKKTRKRIRVLESDEEEEEQPTKEEVKVAKILNTLPSSMRYFVAAWESLDPKAQTLNNLTARLLIEETRNQQSGSSKQDEALLHRQARTKPKDTQRSFQDAKKNTKCHYCHKIGHWSRECRKRLANEKNKSKNLHDSKGSSSDYGLILCDNQVEPNDIWYADSGASCSMTFRREWFKTYTPFTSDHPIYLGDNSTLLAEGMGDIEIQAYVDGGWYNTYIRNVLYSPQLKKNLYSLSTSTRRGFNVIIKHDKLQIFMDNDLKAVGVRHDDLYRMLFKVTSSSQGYITSENKLQLWHERLAHLPVATLREMATKGLVDGLQPQDLEGEFLFCEGCQHGKAHRKSCYPSDGKNYQLGEFIYADICGPMQTQSLSKYLYFCLFKDYFSGYRHIYFIKNKSDVLDIFKEYATLIYTQTGNKIKVLRTDNALEFKSDNFADLCKRFGIIHEFTAPYVHEQIGRIERDNRTIVEAARSMLNSRNLPGFFWAEACNTATNILNRSATKQTPGTTPYELFFGTKPNVANYKIFGCNAYMHIPKENRKKWDNKSIKLMFLGYENTSKNFRLWDWKTRKIRISKDVTFDEKATTHSDRESTKPKEIIFQINSAPDESPVATQEMPPVSDISSHPMITRSKVSNSQCNFALADEPSNYIDAITSSDSERWKLAMDEEIDALNKNKTWTLERLADGHKPIGCKWVYKNKTESDGTIQRFKARLVAKGYSQIKNVDYFDTFSPVVSHNFKTSDADPCIFIGTHNDSNVILALYVDDGIILSKDKEAIAIIMDELEHAFEITSGSVNFFVGLQIEQSEDRASIFIHQSSYIDKILSKFNMADCIPASVPMDPSVILTKQDCPTPEQKEKMPKFPFREAVGSLMFASCVSRPDITYAVSQVSKFLEYPGPAHCTTVKNIFRYLKGTPHMGILFTGQDQLVGYSDSDFARDVDSRKSTTGYAFMMNGGTVSWASQRQPIIALSTTESEYIAACSAAKELIWIRRLLQGIGCDITKETELYIDNQAAIKLVENPVFHKRTKHIDVRYHFIRSKHEEGKAKGKQPAKRAKVEKKKKPAAPKTAKKNEKKSKTPVKKVLEETKIAETPETNDTEDQKENKKGTKMFGFVPQLYQWYVLADPDSSSEKENSPAKVAETTKQESAKTVGPVADVDYNPAKSSYKPIQDACWSQGQPVPYLALAATLEEIENVSGRLRMIEILSNFLRSVLLLSPECLLPCIYLCLNRVAPDFAGVELGLGEGLLMKALSKATGRAISQIKAELATKGDLGLIAKTSRGTQGFAFFAPPKMMVPAVFAKLKDIAQMSGTDSTGKKVETIQKMLAACRGCEAKFLVRSLGGKLRIGLAEQSVLQALAQALTMKESRTLDKQELERNALILKTAYCSLEFFLFFLHSLFLIIFSKPFVLMFVQSSECPSYDLIIPTLLDSGLESLPDKCRITPGLPVKPMLANPTRGVQDVLQRFDNAKFTCEYKYDGERAQVHVLDKGEDKEIQIYSRSQENNTTKYPDIVARLPACLSPSTTSCILDCEAVAWDREAGSILPFQVLSTRKRKDVAEQDIKVQVCLFVFDLLYLNGESLVTKSLRERRDLLNSAVREIPNEFQFAKSCDADSLDDIQAFLDDAIKGSCEGLMIKTLDKDAHYEIAKRSRNWLKLKKDYLEGVGDSLDVVVIGGYHGKGKRTGTYGGFLLACYDEANEEYQTICKIGTGFKEEDLETHTTFLKQHVLPDGPKSYYRYDPALAPDEWFEAVQVWEVKCGDLSKSPVHRAALGIFPPPLSTSFCWPPHEEQETIAAHDWNRAEGTSTNSIPPREEQSLISRLKSGHLQPMTFQNGCKVDPERGVSLRFPRFLRVRDDKTPEQATSAQQVGALLSYCLTGGTGHDYHGFPVAGDPGVATTCQYLMVQGDNPAVGPQRRDDVFVSDSQWEIPHYYLLWSLPIWEDSQVGGSDGEFLLNQ